MVAATKRSASANSNKGGEKKVKFERKQSNDSEEKPARPFKKPGAGGKFNNKKFEKGNKFAVNKRPTNKDEQQKFPPGNQKNEKAPEKVDWGKFKKEKKELRMKRKGAKDMFEVTAQAKKIYEQLKCKTTKDKDNLCRELHILLRGGENYKKLVMAHDTARIVQCMLKHSPADIRREISESLVPLVSQLATSRYAHFCVSRMIKYGTPDIKQKVTDAIFGHILKLINQAQSSAIVDTIYVSYASSQQKAQMRQEFYGDLYKTFKDKNVKCIADVYKDSPHMKLATLNAIKAHLNHIVNKKLVDNSLVHAVLLDYLNECNDEDRAEIITAYSPYIPSLASTKDGVRAAMICFWNSIVKDRRAIVKTLREHLNKLCTHEHGHILLLAIVNSMDDTKALKKVIFDSIFNEIESIVGTEWGRKVIQWFVAPGDKTYFHPHTIAFLEEGLKFSKKDKDVRRAELLEAVEEPLCNAIASNPKFWLHNGHIALTTVAILKSCKGELLKSAFDGLATVICDPNWQVSLKDVAESNSDEQQIKKKVFFGGNGEEKAEEKEEEELVLGIEHAGLHIAVKKLLKLGKDIEDSIKFSGSLTEKLTDAVIDKWLPLNRACFVLLNAYENSNAEVGQQLKELIGKKKNVLKKQTHAASKLLIKNLAIK